jgi:predicted nucleotidyltransferase
MNPTTETAAAEWPQVAEQVLDDLVAAARQAFQDDLRSVVLFGSAAEGRLRPTSDLNLVIVLKRFDKARVDAFREPLRMAHAAGRAGVMFLLETEIALAAEAFAVKFDDIERRRKILFGDDVFAKLAIPRAAMKFRLRQVLMNLSLRLRERYALASLREEQLVMVLADAAGPLRAAAATLLELEGTPGAAPKEALARVALTSGLAGSAHLLEVISQARETQALPTGVAGPAVFQMMALTSVIQERAEKAG